MEAFPKLFEYDYWANGAAIDSIEAAGTAPRALRMMGHILGAQRVWLSRLVGEDSPLAVWPEIARADCRPLLEELHADWLRYLERPAGQLDLPVAYRTTKGDSFETSPGDILTHVILHGQYHRGQIATALREQGAIPAVADYIVFVRE